MHAVKYKKIQIVFAIMLLGVVILRISYNPDMYTFGLNILHKFNLLKVLWMLD